MKPAAAEPKPAQGARLGTFAGVFTPSILTILGIILFQRLGYIVGAGGLARTLAIIAAATAVSVITSLSLAAIATNMRVKGGGDYYLISRTLGVHFGGALGLVLFVAQSVSVAFYCIGFGEATAALLGYEGSTVAIALIAGTATLAIGTVAYIGADLATRLQFVVMGALLAALVSFYFGGLRAADPSAIAGALPPPSHEDSASFWVLFAIFFPAVTGFTQGVSMSGDLRDPARSLPRGTFWAVGLSTIVYISVAVLLAASMPLAELAGDYRAMRKIAAVPWLIDAGVIAATLSSAMASFLGAPRILQSLARDNVIPLLKPFATGAGKADNPRRAVLLAGAVALATIALGNLNTIAALVGMCFLLSYGLLNYATFYEARANSPSFRPRFRLFNAWLSLGGAGLCLVAGVMISPVAAAIAGAMMVALHQYISRTAPEAAWADSRYAYHFRRVRSHLIDMRGGTPHPRDWRPHVLAICNDPVDRVRLLRLASWIDGDSGFTTAVRIVTPPPKEAAEAVARAEQSLSAEIEQAALGTFSRVVSAPTVLDGLRMLIQAHGLGPLYANTLLMSAHEHMGRAKEQDVPADAPPTEALIAAMRQGCNLVLMEAGLAAWERAERMSPLPTVTARRIDVWWKEGATGDLCLLLAHLVTRSPGWGGSLVRVHVIADGPQDAEAGLAKLRTLLDDGRIDAQADAVEYDGPPSLVKHSADATIVFLPLRIRGGRLVGPQGRPLSEALESLPITAHVLAGEDIDLDADHDVPAPDADAKGAAPEDGGPKPSANHSTTPGTP